MEYITGWLVVNGKATFVKCRPVKFSKAAIQVVIPRKTGTFTLKRNLSKTKVACLRRHIKVLQSDQKRVEDAYFEAARQMSKLHSDIGAFKEDLKYAKIGSEKFKKALYRRLQRTTKVH